MTLALRLLLGLIVLELIVAGLYLADSSRRIAPPLPEQQFVDPLTWVDFAGIADEIHEYGTSQDWQRMAEAFVGKGFYQQAELCYAEAARLDSDNFQAELGVAYCRDRTGRMEEANDLYQRLLPRATGEDRQQILYALGRNQLRLENPEAAENWFAENKDFLPARNMLCSLLVETGRPELAAPIVADVLRILPQSLLFRQLQSKIARAAGDTAGLRVATDEAERAELLIPVNFSTDFLTGHNIEYGFNRLLQEYEEIAPSLQPAQRLAILLELLDRLKGFLSPYTLLLKTMAAEAAVAAGQLPELETQLAEFDRLDLHNDVTLRLQGDAARLRGQPEAARAYWERAAQMQPSVALFDRLIDISDQLGHSPPVEQWQAERLYLLGKQAYESREFKTAQLQLTEAVQLNPGHSQAWFYLGQTERLLNNAAAARAAYQECLEQDPTHQRARDWTAVLDESKG